MPIWKKDGMSTSDPYQEWQRNQHDAWEAKCGRCGACCGAFDGDPCEHLRKEAAKGYYCSIYENRFGPHKTVSGKDINCVPIRKILHSKWPGDECCGYKQVV